MDQMNKLQTQIVVAMAMSYVLQWLKRSKYFPLLTERSDRIIKVVWSALVAAGGAVAVTFAFDPTLGQLTVTGLDWTHMWHGFVAFLTSMLSQEAAYRTMIKKADDDH
jgi:hypothetical protein